MPSENIAQLIAKKLSPQEELVYLQALIDANTEKILAHNLSDADFKKIPLKNYPNVDSATLRPSQKQPEQKISPETPLEKIQALLDEGEQAARKIEEIETNPTAELIELEKALAELDRVQELLPPDEIIPPPVVEKKRLMNAENARELLNAIPFVRNLFHDRESTDEILHKLKALVDKGGQTAKDALEQVEKILGDRIHFTSETELLFDAVKNKNWKLAKQMVEELPDKVVLDEVEIVDDAKLASQTQPNVTDDQDNPFSEELGKLQKVKERLVYEKRPLEEVTVKIDPAREKEAEDLVNFVNTFSNQVDTRAGKPGRINYDKLMAIGHDFGIVEYFKNNLFTMLGYPPNSSQKNMIVDLVTAYKYENSIKNTKNLQELKSIATLADNDLRYKKSEFYRTFRPSNNYLSALFEIQAKSIDPNININEFLKSKRQQEKEANKKESEYKNQDAIKAEESLGNNIENIDEYINEGRYPIDGTNQVITLTPEGDVVKQRYDADEDIHKAWDKYKELIEEKKLCMVLGKKMVALMEKLGGKEKLVKYIEDYYGVESHERFGKIGIVPMILDKTDGLLGYLKYVRKNGMLQTVEAAIDAGLV